MKTLFGLFILLAAGAAAGFWVWGSDWDEGPKFRTVTVEQGDLLIAVSATGTVEPVEVIDVGAQIIGRIERFGPDPGRPGKTIDFGSQVKQNDVLAQLDDLPYTAELDKAKANLKVVQADLQRAQAQMAQAANDFERAQVLRDTNAESDFDRAQAMHGMAQAEVAVAQARVEQAEIVKRQAEINLDFATILSPIDGIVIDRRVNVGQTVVAGLNAPSLFLLARSLDRMQVWSAVNEADIGEIHLGQRVTFKVDAYRDRGFNGQVSQIRLNAGISNNVVTYGVVVDIENPEGDLLPYMTANLQFEVARRSGALLVPNQALRWHPEPSMSEPAFAEIDETKSAVLWTIGEDDQLQPIEVNLGLSDGVLTEVTSGPIKAGTQLVVGVQRKAKRDFVSSFVSRVTNTGRGE